MRVALLMRTLKHSRKLSVLTKAFISPLRELNDPTQVGMERCRRSVEPLGRKEEGRRRAVALATADDDEGPRFSVEEGGGEEGKLDDEKDKEEEEDSAHEEALGGIGRGGETPVKRGRAAVAAAAAAAAAAASAAAALSSRSLSRSATCPLPSLAAGGCIAAASCSDPDSATRPPAWPGLGCQQGSTSGGGTGAPPANPGAAESKDSWTEPLATVRHGDSEGSAGQLAGRERLAAVWRCGGSAGL